jgi:hypothetical protein
VPPPQKWVQRAQFEYFGGLAAYMGKSNLREIILASSGAGCGYGQKFSQKPHLDHFWELAADIDEKN